MHKLAVCKKIAEERGGFCLSSEYLGCNVKLSFSCKDGHKWLSSPANIKAGSWCSDCSKTEQSGRSFTCRLNKDQLFLNIKNKVNKSNLTLLDDSFISYRHKYSIKCKRNHAYKMRLDSLNLNCKICDKEDKKANFLKECKELAISKGGQCLSVEYKDICALMNWMCSKFHVWSVGYKHIKNGSWCPNCLYKNESETRNIFEEIFNKPFPKANPKFLNLSRYSHLQLDGYNEELGIAFEYDGKQHYEISAFSKHNGKECLKERQQRDKIKDELCKKNMVKLIRVPFFIKDKKTYILNNLKEIGVLK